MHFVAYTGRVKTKEQSADNSYMRIKNTSRRRLENSSGKTGSHRLLEIGIPKRISRGGKPVFRPIKRFTVHEDALHLG